MKRKRNSQASSCPSAPAIGIDLGTTFSSVSVFRDGKTEIIPTKEGDRRIPSVVYFDPVTGEVSVGRKAKELMEQCPENGIIDAKRFIGRNFEDDFVSSCSKSNQTLFTLVQTQNNHAGFQLNVSDVKIVKSPEDVLAELLKYLKNIASEYLGTVVTEAAVSIPAYFSIAQKLFTKKATELAGLKLLRLVTESAAAVLHNISLRKAVKDTNVLVFHFGGGVLDISVIKADDKTIEVKAVNGDTLLGGRNIDGILFDHFHKEFLSTNYGVTPKDQHKLMDMCVELKEALSAQEEYVLDTHDSVPFFYMSREIFEELTKGVFQRCMDVMKSCLYDAVLSKSDIDEVILIGGSTRIPKIRKMLKRYFNGKPINQSSSLDESISAGASILASILKDNRRQLRTSRQYSIKEALPLSLGIEVSGTYMLRLLPNSALLPTTATEILVTSFNYQTEIQIKIFEGERKNTAYNNDIVDAKVDGLPAKRRGEISVKVTFILDEDGLLTIQAFEASTKRLEVIINKFGLTERRINHTVKQKTRNKRDDDLFERFTGARFNCCKRCNDIKYELHKISSETDRNLVHKNCNDFIELSNHLQFTEIPKMKEAFEHMMKSINGILENNQMGSLRYVPIRNIYHYNLRSRSVPYHLPE